MVVVGARQRGQYPAGRPGGEFAPADGRQQRLGQGLHQAQAPVDPTHIPAGLAGHLPLGQFKSRDQFPDDRPFLNRLPGAPLNTNQDDQQGLSQRTVPQFHPGGIARQAAQGFNAQVAIDQHPAVLLGHRHQRNQLPVVLDRAGQPVDQPGLAYPQGGEAQVQTVQIRFQGLAVKRLHVCHPTRPGAFWR